MYVFATGFVPRHLLSVDCSFVFPFCVLAFTVCGVFPFFRVLCDFVCVFCLIFCL